MKAIFGQKSPLWSLCNQTCSQFKPHEEDIFKENFFSHYMKCQVPSVSESSTQWRHETANDVIGQMILKHGVKGGSKIIHCEKANLMVVYLAIEDDSHPLERSKLGELLLQLPFRGVEAEAENAYTVGRLRGISAAHMSTSIRHGRSTGRASMTAL